MGETVRYDVCGDVDGVERGGVDDCVGDSTGNRATSGRVPARSAARDDSATCRNDGASSQPRSRAAFKMRCLGDGERREGERGVKAGVDMAEDEEDDAEEDREEGDGRCREVAEVIP